MSRYFGKLTAVNSEEQYKKLFDKRGVKEITQFRTPQIEQEKLDSVSCNRHVWKYGDLFWKLSSKFYGDPQYWWVIATFNRKPTEGHVEIGELIKIPVDLAEALQVVK
jgi:nucleoid-associated protein YgaU